MCRTCASTCAGLSAGRALLLAVTVGLALYGVVQMGEVAPMRVLSGHTDDVTGLAFLSTRDRVLISGSRDTTLRIWDVLAGKAVMTFEPPEGLYQGAQKARGTIFDPVTGKRPPFIRSIAVSQDDAMLAAGCSDKTVRVWDRIAKKELYRVQVEDSGPFGRGNAIFGVAFSPDSKTLAAVSFDGLVRLYKAQTGDFLRSLKGHADPAYTVAFAANGKLLASGGSDQSVRLWDPGSGKALAKLDGHTHYVLCVAFSPNSRFLVSGSGEVFRDVAGELRIWDLTTQKEIAKLEGHEGPICAVAFSPDGTILASAGGSQYAKRGEVILWNFSERREITRLSGHQSTVNALAFSADGTFLASGSSDDTIRIWDLKSILRKP